MSHLIRCLILGLIFVTGVVRAAPVTYQFGGTISSVDPLLAGEISPDATFFGSVTFDTSTADSDPNPTRGVYTPAPAFSLVVGGLSYSRNSGGSGSVTIQNEFSPSVDSFLANSGGQIIGQEILGYSAFGIFLLLEDYTGTAFSGDGFPLDPPDFSDFDLASFRMQFRNDLGEAVGIAGSLNFLREENIVSIPEPASLMLFGLSLACLGLLRQRHQFPKPREPHHVLH